MRPEWLALGIAALACQSDEAELGCSPTPSCSLRADRLGPPEARDAGPASCKDEGEHCQAELISAGGAHTCAVAMAGELICFGADDQGQLGLPVDTSDAGEPMDAGRHPGGFAAIDEAVREVAAGGAHTCALTATQRVLCFGRNVEGQVDGLASEPRTVTAVAIDGAMQVAAGAAHSCALTTDGVTCWGSARYGQTGLGASEAAQAPSFVPGTEDAVEVAAGVRHGCARLADGRVLCWGELVDEASGEPRVSEGPELVPGIDDAIGVTAGAGHSCVLREGGGVACFGRNDSGQVGDGSLEPRARPVAITVEPALEVSAGGVELDGALVGHTCVKTSGFHLSCWGRNAEGQLGVGRAPDAPSPAVVRSEEGETEEAFLRDIRAIATGGLHTCGIEDDGELFCFGDDRQGQRGLEGDEPAPFGRAKETRHFGGAP